MSTGNGSIKLNSITTPDNITFSYLGDPLDAGPLPTFFYFSLSGEESLTLPPYNQPASFFAGLPCRVFSLTLPAHGPGFDKFIAMETWAEMLSKEPYFIEHFSEVVAQAITWLVDQGLIASDKIAFGGLSRGVFIACHIAARQPHVSHLVGYAPLTRLGHLKAFASYLEFPDMRSRVPMLDLHTLIPKLSHLKSLKLYSGIHDTLVGTEHCLDFVKALAAAKADVELLLYPSIGHGGHGTPPHIFEQGAAWIKNQLIEE